MGLDTKAAAVGPDEESLRSVGVLAGGDDGDGAPEHRGDAGHCPGDEDDLVGDGESLVQRLQRFSCSG